jgi:hypothetical protein
MRERSENGSPRRKTAGVGKRFSRLKARAEILRGACPERSEGLRMTEEIFRFASEPARNEVKELVLNGVKG